MNVAEQDSFLYSEREREREREMKRWDGMFKKAEKVTSQKMRQ
jgi:hypothetical protein